MVQGTTSSAGKSLLCTALCRIFKQDGYKAWPFKSQNMSSNSYVTKDGMEMGIAQVLQAKAAGVEPNCLMNPILLKPTTDRKSQVIIKGKPYENMDAVKYFEYKVQLKPMIKEVFDDIENNCDIVVIEGAGSPAEINLKENDIVNMGMAEMADSPVILVADIDRGGVFASLYGTIALLDEDERKRIKGLVINKFRGDKSILQSGVDMIEELVHIPVVGIIPYMDLKLEDEDSAIDFEKGVSGSIDIAVIKLPRMANFTDIHPFKFDDDVSTRYITGKDEIKDADMIIIPGSKNTIEDLRWLKETGIYDDIRNFNGLVFGICSGYEMMGKELVYDESREKGLGLFNTVTELNNEEITANVRGTAFGKKIKGYEIRCGRIIENENPFVRLQGENNRYYSDGDFKYGKYFGTYVHGIFDSGDFREYMLNIIRKKKNLEEKKGEDLDMKREEELNKLAKIVRENMDIEYIYSLMNI